jgi:hypothetical protein
MSDCAYQFDDVLSTDAHWIRGFPSQQCLTPEGTIMIPCPWQSHIVDGESMSIFPRISSFVHGLNHHFQLVRFQLQFVMTYKCSNPSFLAKMHQFSWSVGQSDTSFFRAMNPTNRTPRRGVPGWRRPKWWAPGSAALNLVRIALGYTWYIVYIYIFNCIYICNYVYIIYIHCIVYLCDVWLFANLWRFLNIWFSTCCSGFVP